MNSGASSSPRPSASPHVGATPPPPPRRYTYHPVFEAWSQDVSTTKLSLSSSGIAHMFTVSSSVLKAAACGTRS